MLCKQTIIIFVLFVIRLSRLLHLIILIKKMEQIKPFLWPQKITSFQSIYSITSKLLEVLALWVIPKVYLCKIVSERNFVFLSLLSELFEIELKHIRYICFIFVVCNLIKSTNKFVAGLVSFFIFVLIVAEMLKWKVRTCI